MNHGIKTVIYPVRDIARAKAMYTKFSGVEPTTDKPYYVGFRVGDQEIGLDPHGHKDGPIAYWHVDDINESLRTLVDAGAQVQDEIKDVGGGKLMAAAKDGDGNVIGLIQSP